MSLGKAAKLEEYQEKQQVKYFPQHVLYIDIKI